MSIRSGFVTVLAVLAVLASAGSVAAQSANQTVNYEVQAINQISLAGSPNLVVSAATAGSGPTAATAGATYSITTNGTNMKITVAINSNMESGLTLTTSMTAPSASGVSAGAVTLSTSAQDAVTGMNGLNESGLAITYELTATTAAGVVAPSSRTVTYTVVQGS